MIFWLVVGEERLHGEPKEHLRGKLNVYKIFQLFLVKNLVKFV